MPSTFSHRYGYHPLTGKVVYDEAPSRLRNQYCNLLQELEVSRCLSAGAAYSCILDALGKVSHPGSRAHYADNPHNMIDLFKNAEWYEFFDIVEQVASLSRSEINTDVYQRRVNELFERESVGWRFREGQLVKTTSPETDEAIDQALLLLGEPAFAGPSSQFRKAIEFLSARPKPDLENAVKEAVGALEATAKIVTENRKGTLGDAVKELVRRNWVAQPLDKVFHGVYGFASDVPGIRHGMHMPNTLEAFEAELVLGVCSSCIAFLIRISQEQPPTEGMRQDQPR